MKAAADLVPDRTIAAHGDSESIADLFLAASRELASSEARLYRSLGRPLSLTKELLAQEESLTDCALHKQNLPRELKGENSFERQTRHSLQELCRLHGITGYSRMPKKVMIECLVAKGVQAPQIPLEALTKAELIDALRNMIMREQHAD